MQLAVLFQDYDSLRNLATLLAVNNTLCAKLGAR